MFRAFLAHSQEILYCLVSRYGKRKCALWCPVVWCGRSFRGTVWVYTHTHFHLGPTVSVAESAKFSWPCRRHDGRNVLTRLNLLFQEFRVFLFCDDALHKSSRKASVYCLMTREGRNRCTYGFSVVHHQVSRNSDFNFCTDKFVSSIWFHSVGIH
jgi:hypothetical protein